jgi:hypothetical protein
MELFKSVEPLSTYGNVTICQLLIQSYVLQSYYQAALFHQPILHLIGMFVINIAIPKHSTTLVFKQRYFLSSSRLALQMMNNILQYWSLTTGVVDSNRFSLNKIITLQ